MPDRPARTDTAFGAGAKGADDAAWRAVAEHALATSIETLESRTIEGFPIPPLSPRRHADPSQPWRPNAAWSVSQRIDHPDPDTANALALADLEGGADAVVLVGAESPYARGFGLRADDVDLDQALAAVELDFIGLSIDVGAETPAFAAALAELAVRRRLTSANLAVELGWDPVGLAARLGAPVADALPRLLEVRQRAGFAGPILCADGRPWHEAGAGEAQELAGVLGTGVAYLRRLEALSLPLAEAFGLVGFRIAADAEIFLGIAKLRALRRLWACIAEASGIAAAPMRLHVETSWRMMSRRDPWTNAMRTTAAAFAAGIGGADAITVLPFTLPLGLPDPAARRLARNLQHVLLEEAHLAAVEDPAAGAGGLEALTDTFCAEAWSRFQAIERDGGIERALPRLAQEVAETAVARATDLAHDKRSIIGTSRFARLDLPEAAVLDVAPIGTAHAPDVPLPERRDAVPFEALRDHVDAAVRGTRPDVFLATLGKPAAFGPRASEAANLFATAGLAAEAGLEARDTDSLVAAFEASGARVACLCGTEAAYETDGVSLARALRAAGAALILLVGQADAALADDVDATLHEGCDLPAVLELAIAHALP